MRKLKVHNLETKKTQVTTITETQYGSMDIIQIL